MEWEFDPANVTNGKHDLINYDYMDEFSAYRMQYSYDEYFNYRGHVQDYSIRQEVENYGINSA